MYYPELWDFLFFLGGVGINVFSMVIVVPLIMWEDLHYRKHRVLTVRLYLTKTLVGIPLLLSVLIPSWLYVSTISLYVMQITQSENENPSFIAILSILCTIGAFRLNAFMFVRIQLFLKRFEFFHKDEINANKVTADG